MGGGDEARNRPRSSGFITIDKAQAGLAHTQCEQIFMSNSVPDDEFLYCNATWDGLMCWNSTPAGNTAIKNCPYYVAEYDKALFAEKKCTSNGTWWRHPLSGRPWSNYQYCINEKSHLEDTTVLYCYIAGYLVSIALLFVALFIFFYFKQLQCERITLHKHLFISYVFTGLTWICYYLIVTVHVEILTENSVWCRALYAMAHYFTLSNYLWMFCEGLYLHTIIVTPFQPGKPLTIFCCLLGWLSPLIPLSIYAPLRVSSLYNDLCWIRDYPLHLIITGTAIASLLLNLIFLINIVRILVTKLRANATSESARVRKAVKATLILVPLLGLQFLLMPGRPTHGSTFDLAYRVSVACVISSQGAFVALVFCFLNGEVRYVLKRKLGLSGCTSDLMSRGECGSKSRAQDVTTNSTFMSQRPSARSAEILDKGDDQDVEMKLLAQAPDENNKSNGITAQPGYS